MATMQPLLITQATIKPSFGTPSHLQKYNLSLLDQLAPHVYVPIVFFYPNVGCDTSLITSRIKNSLSETLTRYYPFAGRLADGISVCCNDEGVEFFEVKIGCRLSDILEKPDPKTLDILYPGGVLENGSYKGSLVVVQVTFFECGGISIGICMLHKVTDGSTRAAFISDWAAIGRLSSTQGLSPPDFISASLSPLIDPPKTPEIKFVKGNYVTKRFVFDASKLADLKAEVNKSGVPDPSRVEVVTALLYRCAMAASPTAKSLDLRSSKLIQPVNLRPRIVPPMPNKSAGNFSGFFWIMVKNEEDKKLHKLVGALREEKANFFKKYAKNMTVNECYSLMCESIKEASKVLNKKNDEKIDVYRSSSMCRYPFNHIDFGWGKPLWYGTSSSFIKNSFRLMDAMAPGGIEAWVTLEEEEMAIFECDEELLAFASLNPSALGSY